MGGKNYIPRPNPQFNDWFTYLKEYVTERLAPGAQLPNPWNHIPQANMTELVSAYTDWQNNYIPTLGPMTPGMRVARDEARRRAESVIRPFVQRFLMWPPVTDEDRTNMGLPVRDTTRTTIFAPTVGATGIISYPGVNLIEVRDMRAAEDVGADERAKWGYRIHFAILPNETDEQGRLVDDGGRWRILRVPRTPEDLPHSVFTRRRRYQFEFLGDSGMRVFFSICYENSKGVRGPFGPMLQAIIP